jgi:hypothetical protein
MSLLPELGFFRLRSFYKYAAPLELSQRPRGTRAAVTQVPVSYELPPDAVCEAIVNAVGHRDYTSTGRTAKPASEIPPHRQRPDMVGGAETKGGEINPLLTLRPT